jgi:hypothetical protein
MGGRRFQQPPACFPSWPNTERKTEKHFARSHLPHTKHKIGNRSKENTEQNTTVRALLTDQDQSLTNFPTDDLKNASCFFERVVTFVPAPIKEQGSIKIAGDCPGRQVLSPNTQVLFVISPHAFHPVLRFQPLFREYIHCV